MEAGAIVGICLASIALLIGIYLLLKLCFQGPSYKKSNRIDEKIVLITGANTGIGKETALELAKRGATVYMACRDMQRAEKAREDILAVCGHKKVYCRQLDLGSLESVRKFADAFKKEVPKLDILINNAGVYNGGQKLTKDGFEIHIGVNHLGPFLLTNLLLDQLKAAAPSRIVVVASVGHTLTKFNMDGTSLDKTSKDRTSELDAYSLSKLANVLFAKELAKRLQGTGVTVNSLHPGVVGTDIVRYNGFYRFLTNSVLWPFLKTVKNGAQTTIYVALDPKLETVTGKYFTDCKLKETGSSANDESVAKWLWEESITLTKLNDCGV